MQIKLVVMIQSNDSALVHIELESSRVYDHYLDYLVCIKR